MKIQLVSDLHLEFSPIDITNTNNADVLILAGDICVANYFSRGEASPLRAIADGWREWFWDTCAQYDQVIYILGNHEHYKGRFYETFDVLQKALAHVPNLHILDQTWIDIGDYRFVGGTLWTNFDFCGVKALIVRDGLNDYSSIQGKDYRKLVPAETSLYNQQMLRLIDAQCSTDRKIVVVGHHAPSYRSVHERYVKGIYASLNPGYASHLDNFILDHPQIVAWIHGHTHDSFDYEIGDTRIVCNPRGYQKTLKVPPENRNFDPNFTLELP